MTTAPPGPGPSQYSLQAFRDSPAFTPPHSPNSLRLSARRAAGSSSSSAWCMVRLSFECDMVAKRVLASPRAQLLNLALAGASLTGRHLALADAAAATGPCMGRV